MRRDASKTLLFFGSVGIKILMIFHSDRLKYHIKFQL